MYQLLPEVKSIFETHLKGKYKTDFTRPQDKNWEQFMALLNECDKKAEIIKENLCNELPSAVREPFRYALSLKNHYDRTFLSVIATIACGSDPWRYLKYLFGFDMLDSSLLIVDDMIDKVKRRGNKEAHHIRYGIETTLTISEILKARAYRLMLELPVNDTRKVKIIDELQKNHEEIYIGQNFDVIYEHESDIISIEDYLKMVSLTTGYEIQSFFKIVAYITDREEISEKMGEIGLKLGTLSQIRDDLIDYIPDERLIHKQPFSDFLNNKKRLPLLIGWKNATPLEKKKLLGLQKKKRLDPDEELSVLSILFKEENIEEIRQIMNKIKEEGLKLINSLDITDEGKSLLITLFKLGADEI